MSDELRTTPSFIKGRLFGLQFAQEIKKNPLGAARRLQAEHGDLVVISVLGTTICYCFRPEIAREILLNQHDVFVKDSRQLTIFQSVQGKNVITTEGTAWERQRRILTPAFSSKRIADYVALMNSAVDEGMQQELPRYINESKVIDANSLMTRITMDVILRALFSYQGTRDEANAVSNSVRSLTRQNMRELFWPFIPPDWVPYPGRSAKRRHIATLDRLLTTQIRVRQNYPKTITSQDVLAVMLETRNDHDQPGSNCLSNEEVRSNCFGLFGAGHDTAASALTWWIGLMAVHSSIAERVRQEVKSAESDLHNPDVITGLPLLNATLKEALRLYPPSTAVFGRRALRDAHIGNVDILKGTLVIIPIWSMHHDERWFPEPDQFQPERFLSDAPPIPRGAYMPFGAGPHFCLGQHFAMVEMALIAAKLVGCYKFSLLEGDSLPSPIVDLVLRPKTSLQIQVTRSC